VLQHVTVCCKCVASVLQCVAVCYSMLQCVAVCCSVLQCIAMCCSVLQSAHDCVSVSSFVSVCVYVGLGVYVCTEERDTHNQTGAVTETDEIRKSFAHLALPQIGMHMYMYNIYVIHMYI